MLPYDISCDDRVTDALPGLVRSQSRTPRGLGQWIHFEVVSTLYSGANAVRISSEDGLLPSVR